MPLNATDDKLYLAFLFRVAVRQRTIAGFNEVSGLAIESDVQTLREGGVNGFEHQLVGPTRYTSRLVLKRGLGDPRDLWNWYLDVLAGKIERQTLTIMLDNVGTDGGLRWTFNDACPVKWTGPELRASNSAVAFETIELVHRGQSIGSA
ncbi:MAG TPA: phage tail protein [Paraburkholderia sp.]|jgi:phage tail-like protein|nr:phage tail protein [Paraburkholderia sp.]